MLFSKKIALPGFEPGLRDSESRRLDHCLTGLDYNKLKKKYPYKLLETKIPSQF